MGSEDNDRELERLRAENETLRRDVKTAVMGDSAELQDVKRENEKLREKNDYLRLEKERLGKDVYNLIVKKDEARAENETLRLELEEMREACQANYMLGIERGKEDARNIAAAAAIRESGDE